MSALNPYEETLQGVLDDAFAIVDSFVNIDNDVKLAPRGSERTRSDDHCSLREPPARELRPRTHPRFNKEACGRVGHPPRALFQSFPTPRDGAVRGDRS